MKKSLTVLVCTLLMSAPAFATYIVVLKNGTRYSAKAKWTVTNGRALVLLENGQSLQLDPALIDVQKSEQLTKLGLANANVIDLNAQAPERQVPQQPSLGSTIKLRKPGQQAAEQAAAAKAAAAATPAPIPTGGTMSSQVLDKFQRAYENVGIFEQKVDSTGPQTIRVELTADTEERVFNAISATSFLMVRNAGVDTTTIEVVELFMKTTTGGAAGRFKMTRADAEALDKRTISQQEYFVRKVIY